MKQYHLLAKGKEQKDQVLTQIAEQTQWLIQRSTAVIQRVGQTTSQAVRSAAQRIKQMAQVSRPVLPQIRPRPSRPRPDAPPS